MKILFCSTIIFMLIGLPGCNSKNPKNTDELNNSLRFNERQDKSKLDISQALSLELSQEHLAGTFDGSILITAENQVLLNHSYGLADRKKKIKNTNNTISDIGSIAKTFTAAAILQLISNNRLKLNDTIGQFFPDAPQSVTSLTIEQLLSHSSGMDNFHNVTDFDPMSKEEAVAKILSMPIIAKPTEKIAYSNAAYTLLAAIIERQTDQTFQQYIHQNILKPLSLSNTGFYGETHLTNLARGYGGTDSGATTFEKGLTWALVGQGGMVSSLDDLHLWFKALREGKIFPVNSQNLAFVTANEKWKLGNIRYFDSWGPRIFHMGGSTDYGYTALVQFIPEYEVTIIMLLNSYNDKYAQATHQKLSQNHVVPILVKGANAVKSSNKRI